MVKTFIYLNGMLEDEERKEWKKFAISGFFRGAIDIFSFFVMLYLINASSGRDDSEGVFQAAALILIFFSEIVIELYRCRLSNHFLYYGAHNLSMKIFELFAKEDLEHHNQKSVMQALAVIRNDTVSSINIILILAELCNNIFTMIGYTAILFLSVKIFGVIISIILVVFMAGILFLYRMKIRDYGDKCRRYGIKANSQISLGYGIYAEMKMSHRITPIMERYHNASLKYAQTQSEYGFQTNFITVLMNLWTKATMVIIFITLFLSRVDISAFIPITVYASILGRLVSIEYNVANEINSIEFSKKSYEMLKECLDRYEELKREEKHSKSIRQKKVTLQKGLYINNLTFGYDENKKILENASISIPAGHSVAVIGESGVGKTTFLSLILGLLKPQSGEILYDDYNLVTQTDSDGICKGEIGDIVSYIPQIIYMNGETVRNNVTLLTEQSQIDDERVIECLKCAQIWEDVSEMPEGIHTLVGENGVTISGGQRQRIALARALYKDFQLLVMDEATAALDMDKEKAVMDSIRQVKADKTLLIVTHHMSLTEECDMVYKIENKAFVQIK